MGVDGLVGGLFSLASAGIRAASASHVQSANAAAQADINAKTMSFNRTEAKKARDFQAAQAVIDRNFNSAEALKARQFQANQTQQALDYNAQQAAITRKFEERMSSTAHQREVNDLYAAGLNPILSVNSGAAAMSAPAASAVIGSAPAASHSGSGAAAAMVSGLSAYQRKNIVGEFVSTAMEGLRLDNDLRRAKAQDLAAQAAMKNAEAKEYGEKWRHYLENERLNISKAEANARIDKLNTDIKIAYEDLDIRKDLRDASVEERRAMVSKLMADVDVSKGQAALLGLQQEELSRKMRYGSVLMTYLPADVRDKVASHLIDFVAENGDLLNDFLNKSHGDIFDSKQHSKEMVEGWCRTIINWCEKKGF